MKASPAVALVGLAVAGCATLVSNEPAELADSAARAGTQILVTVPQDEPAPARGLTGAPGQAYQRRRGYGPPPRIDRSLDQLARDYGLRRLRGWPIRSIGVYCEVFEVGPGQDADATIARLGDDPRVDMAERMRQFETLGSHYNDPYADLQTAVTELALEPAHRLATGRGVTVAVIDSQIDIHHPELRQSIRYAEDLVGSGPPGSPEIHGTAVAGVIASAANNTEGIVGIAPDAGLAALRACWAPERNASAARCSSFSIAQALEVALELDTKIINLSLTGPTDTLLGRMLDEAMARGIIVVAASADEPGGQRGFPASHPGVIAAQQETGIHRVAARLLTAPGSEILTTIPAAGYGFFSGSSFAAAHVTGVAALLVERSPGIDGETLAALLSETAGTAESPDAINACRALSRLVPSGGCVDERSVASVRAAPPRSSR